ncbi:unnamed protein product [Bursaphelenchus okinawaensis]|uniref:J domain-containing protein n=1 Tax=Bursaphelenchus okinawaensis TaxID=465554 RepID=A0A811KLI7_9BILA|nr:unnamed protein product [Bursaphelenchus okinawaensis]CAG9106269.1 unnamed protein product [Bursaphelenchus okinawaensis]
MSSEYHSRHSQQASMNDPSQQNVGSYYNNENNENSSTETPTNRKRKTNNDDIEDVKPKITAYNPLNDFGNTSQYSTNSYNNQNWSMNSSDFGNTPYAGYGAGFPFVSQSTPKGDDKNYQQQMVPQFMNYDYSMVNTANNSISSSYNSMMSAYNGMSSSSNMMFGTPNNSISASNNVMSGTSNNNSSVSYNMMPHNSKGDSGYSTSKNSNCSNSIQNSLSSQQNLQQSTSNSEDDADKPQGIEIKPGDELIKFDEAGGRLALLNSNVKHTVTVAEMKRRFQKPEEMNLSFAGGYLRKAKNKDGGKIFKNQLAQFGMYIPAGRRRGADPTAFTSLTESEASILVEDFHHLNQSHFPQQPFHEQVLIEFMRPENYQQLMLALAQYPNPQFVAHLIKLCYKISADVLMRDRSVYEHRGMMWPIECQRPLGRQLQNGLDVYNRITHDFGSRACASMFLTLAGDESRSSQFRIPMSYEKRLSTKPVDHYQVLGVKPKATAAEIKSAFYELSKKYHPDTKPDDHEKAAELFQQVAASYEILGNAANRAEYDKSLKQPHRTRANPYDHSQTKRQQKYKERSEEQVEFERRFREYEFRKSRPEFTDPDEFFKRFGNRKFKSRLDSEDVTPDYKAYNDEQARVREAEERRIAAEIQRDREKRGLYCPTFQQLLMAERERKRSENKDMWKICGVFTVAFLLIVASRI